VGYPVLAGVQVWTIIEIVHLQGFGFKELIRWKGLRENGCVTIDGYGKLRHLSGIERELAWHRLSITPPGIPVLTCAALICVR
jgi:hypothetical protein